MTSFKSAENIKIKGKHGTLFTYEVTGVSQKIAEQRARTVSSARFPRKIGASRVIKSREVGNGLITAYEIQIFLLSEDLVDELGVERAINGLQELGILD